MREMGLRGAVRGRRVTTIVPTVYAERPLDLVERNFTAKLTMWTTIELGEPERIRRDPLASHPGYGPEITELEVLLENGRCLRTSGQGTRT